MAKREFVMLAHPRKAEPIGGWFWSEKLDGQRAFWDGGITRGMKATDVPFANTAKDARYITPPLATGLWSRYGKVLQAPDWWLDLMPDCMLDGELYMGLGSFQSLMSTVKKLTPGPEWRNVQYKVFDSPPPHVIFANGEIDNINFQKEFRNVISRLPRLPGHRPERWDFRSVHSWLEEQDWWNDTCQLHVQQALSPMSRAADDEICTILDRVLSGGGEGIMVRNPSSFWAPQRSRTLLKIKGSLDAEAEVIGYTAGRETDKGSKLLGMMGALILRFKGKVFELSGFTEEERGLEYVTGGSAAVLAMGIPGERLPATVHNPQFPRGSVVSFRYRELTDDGIPKEARYWRQDTSI